MYPNSINYNIVNPSYLPEFIISRRKQVDPIILNEIARLIESNCITYHLLSDINEKNNELN